MKAYAYCRGSTPEQQATLSTQEEMIKREYHHRFDKDYEWGGVYTDTASGNVQFKVRPAGMRLNSTLEKGDMVIMSKLDRGFRNMLDLAAMLKDWIDRGIRLILLDIQLDLATPVGRMIAHILGAVAEFERERISERIREGHARRKAQGKHLLKFVRYGFKWAGPKGQRRIVPDLYTRRIVQQWIIWREVNKMSDRRIWAECLVQRIRREDGTQFSSHSQIAKMILKEKQLQAYEAEQAQQAQQAQQKSQNPNPNPNGGTP